MARDKNKLKEELKNSEVTFKGDAPAHKRGTFEKLVDLFNPSPEKKLSIMTAADNLKAIGAAVVLASLMVGINVAAVHAKTVSAVNDLNNPPPITAPYQHKVPSGFEIVDGLLHELGGDLKERREAMDEAEKIDAMNRDVEFTPTRVIQQDASAEALQRLKQGEEMIYGDISVTLKCVSDYQDKVAPEINVKTSSSEKLG